jgi:putative Holliday junction resolvase
MGRILGIDYGTSRVGVALGDEEGIIAFPLAVLEVRGDREAARRVAALCTEHAVSRVVVGMPVNMNGTHGPMADAATRFAERLGRACPGVSVVTWDERLTSVSAERALLDADMSRSGRRARRDKVAAQLMLQSYLDARGSA